MRVPLEAFAGDRAPYALNFLAVVIATVVAGWRSGLIALAFGQWLVWYAVVPPRWSIAVPDGERLGGLVLATVSQIGILLIIALYQREIDKGVRERERRLQLLDNALHEIDHRTKNNYQTVVALILLQAQRAEDPAVRVALGEAADRVRALSLASDHLARRSEDLGTIRLGDHLRELCQQLRRGLSSEQVKISCDIEDMTTGADTAIHLSIIVNELVTNSVKHAFNGHGGEVRVSCARADRGVEVVVADNGRGMTSADTRTDGLGTKLVARFVEELNARHEVVSAEGSGTTHRILVDQLD